MSCGTQKPYVWRFTAVSHPMFSSPSKVEFPVKSSPGHVAGGDVLEALVGDDIDDRAHYCFAIGRWKKCKMSPQHHHSSWKMESNRTSLNHSPISAKSGSSHPSVHSQCASKKVITAPFAALAPNNLQGDKMLNNEEFIGCCQKMSWPWPPTRG